MTVKMEVAVIGGGLVGAIEACFLAKRGFKVDLYEGRPDIREQEHVKGKSINMALSLRGREALRHVEIEEEVVSNGIPMFSRMIHTVDEKTKTIPYGTQEQYIMSIERRRLNEILISGAEKYDATNIFFDHKLIRCNSSTGEIVLFNNETKKEVKAKYDLIVGCDGAYSATRRQLMRQTRIDFSQEYISHGYLELTIPPTSDKQFAMDVNHLHIWPRNEFMLIALPNPDKSFTVTLFMPFSMFDMLKTEEDIVQFYNKQFPDAFLLIGRENVIESHLTSSPLALLSIKCKPYDANGRVVILGDAAHAIVPFYGQGMNSGLEDCLVLDDLMDKHINDMERVLPAYSDERYKDALAICDLAMYNYIEMRKSVNSKFFLLRKKLDNFLYWLMPTKWVPLYTMVSFTRIPYSQCLKKRKTQDKIINVSLASIGLLAAAGLGIFFWTRLSRGRKLKICWKVGKSIYKGVDMIT